MDTTSEKGYWNLGIVHESEKDRLTPAFSRMGLRFYFTERFRTNEGFLRERDAWNDTVKNPLDCYELWIYEDDWDRYRDDIVALCPRTERQRSAFWKVEIWRDFGCLGVFSLAMKERLSTQLSQMNVRFVFGKAAGGEDLFRQWDAWDETADDPLDCHELWVEAAALKTNCSAILGLYPKRTDVAPYVIKMESRHWGFADPVYARMNGEKISTWVYCPTCKHEVTSATSEYGDGSAVYRGMLDVSMFGYFHARDHQRENDRKANLKGDPAGVFCKAQSYRLQRVLAEREIEFFFKDFTGDENLLREERVWDDSAEDPCKCYQLFVDRKDLNKVVPLIVDLFPDRSRDKREKDKPAGIFSKAQRELLDEALARRGIRFSFKDYTSSPGVLQFYHAWDEAAPDPRQCYHLLVDTDDFEKAGSVIWELFPDRKR